MCLLAARPTAAICPPLTEHEHDGLQVIPLFPALSAVRLAQIFDLVQLCLQIKGWLLLLLAISVFCLVGLTVYLAAVKQHQQEGEIPQHWCHLSDFEQNERWRDLLYAPRVGMG